MIEIIETTDRNTVKELFELAYQVPHENQGNYNEYQAANLIYDLINFYIIIENNELVGFAGIKDYGKYCRIFERYFIFPKFRTDSLKYKFWGKYIVKQMIEKSIENKKIPFYSTQTLKKRNALKIAVKEMNKYLDGDYKFNVLDGLYLTVKYHEHNENCWQNIAILDPHTTIDLPNKE